MYLSVLMALLGVPKQIHLYLLIEDYLYVYSFDMVHFGHANAIRQVSNYLPPGFRPGGRL